MESKSIIACLIIGLGTFIFRFIPFLFGEKMSNSFFRGLLPFFKLSGISIIASLFILSLNLNINLIFSLYAIKVILSCLAVIFCSIIFKNPGISVLIGIFVFFVTNLVI